MLASTTASALIRTSTAIALERLGNLAVGDETYLATSDVDGDGDITTVDITVIYSILLGE